MINLNDDKFSDKEFLSEKNLFELISDYDVFKYYIKNFQLNTAINSPIRKDDKPSFSVYYSDRNNRLLYKDFSNGDAGSCIKMVMLLFNLNYREALEKIAIDFRLNDNFKINNGVKPSRRRPIIHTKEHIEDRIIHSTNIQVLVRNWKQYDLRFWDEYGISLPTLMKYNVFPIDYIFINDHVIKADKYSYAYVERKDGLLRYKIYQPFSEKMKWINNMVDGTISGWNQLSTTGELLLITSSLKDAMCLHDIGLKDVIAPQTENYIFKQHIIDDLKNRFNKIILFYDNDDPGIRAANKIKELYNIDYITTKSKFKDPSDYYKNTNKDKLLKLIKDELFYSV